jgi:hypothetical protein
VRGFLFSGYSLRLRKPKQKASANGRVKNHRRPLFRVYKGPGEIHSKLRPNPPRNSNSKAKRPFPRTTRARATTAPRIARPIALTPQQGKQHLSQVKRTSFRLCHDDRVKKRCAMPFKFISFSSSPFSLLLTGTGKGDTSKGILLREGSGPPSPPTYQGFKGWPLGRVLQPPQSTPAPSSLLIRGSKAGPSEGFDSRPRALGLRAHY